MNILSLFDGMSVAQQALKELGIKVNTYYASEIDKYAIAVTQSNFPNTIQLGDIKGIYYEDGKLSNDVGMGGTVHRPCQIDLLIGGSHCQDLSIAKKDRQGLKGQRSGLFYEYVRIRNEVKPKYFILENVNSMPKEAKRQISEILGVQPVMINASLVSAQNRKRLFWIGKWNGEKYEQVKMSLPKDKEIMLKDILEQEVDDKYCVSGVALRNRRQGKKPEYNNIEKANAMTTVQTDSMIRIGHLNSGGQGDRIYSQEGKSTALSANGGGRGAKTGLYMVKESMHIRKLTPIECLRLQSMPDDYFNKAIATNKPISNTQRYKMCGNAFNCEVVKYILNNLLNNYDRRK